MSFDHKEKLYCIKLVKKQRKEVKKKIGKDPLSIVMCYLYNEGKNVSIGEYHDVERYKPINFDDLKVYKEYKYYDRIRNNTVEGNVYCSCVFSFKDDLKKLGFKFDKKTKWWCINKEKLTSDVYCNSLKERFTNHSSVGVEYYRYVQYKSKDDYNERLKEVNDLVYKRMVEQKKKEYDNKKINNKTYDNSVSLF